VLGHSTLEPYLDHKTNPLLRLDRRYANRITKGKFTRVPQLVVIRESESGG
jgi:hypothetical protein